MALVAGGTAPYAPPAAVIEVIRRHRERGLPTPFTREVLERAGIPETLSQRTMQALRLIDFIDGEGNPSPEFDALARAPEAEYRELLSDLICSAYREVINFADPATDNYDRVRDAFRGYNPRGQQERMITLFLGLLEFAGMSIEAAAATRRPAERSGQNGQRRESGTKRAAPRGSSGTSRRSPIRQSLPDRDDPRDAALVAWFNTRPDPGTSWPTRERDSFMLTLRAIIDGIYSETPAEDARTVTEN